MPSYRSYVAAHPLPRRTGLLSLLSVPFGAAMKLAGYDTSFAKYPKVKALADRATAALPAGAFPTKYTAANPFNMP